MKYRYKIITTQGSYYSTTPTPKKEMESWKRGYNKYSKQGYSKIVKIISVPLVKKRTIKRTQNGGMNFNNLRF